MSCDFIGFLLIFFLISLGFGEYFRIFNTYMHFLRDFINYVINLKL